MIHNEILRSQRYHHPFSIVVLKLVHTELFEEAPELQGTEKKSAEAVAFSRLLIDDTRKQMVQAATTRMQGDTQRHAETV